MARALATEAELLVLDEPTEGMDLPSEAALIALIRRLNTERGITVVLVSHLLHMVANTVPRLGLLTDGQLRLGPTGEMFTSETLAEVYGVAARVTVVDGRRFIVPGLE
jgi:ABC-type Mn2+/Zn2+ transport system ATPase subunit